MRSVTRASLVIAGCLVIGVGSAAAETVSFSLNPPRERFVHATVDIDTALLKGQTGDQIAFKSSEHIVDELRFFSKEEKDLGVEWHLVSHFQNASGQEVRQLIEKPLMTFRVRLALSQNGQGQQVTPAGLVDQLKAQAPSMGLDPGVITPENVEGGLLSNWNALFGSLWSMMLTRDVQLGSPATFHGQLQLGLPHYDRMVTAIQQAPLSGVLTVRTTRTAAGQAAYQLEYTYSGEAALDHAAQEQLAGAIGEQVPSFATQHWSTSKINGKGQALFDAQTLLISESTLRQEMVVEDEQGVAFRLHRTTHLTMTW